MNTRPLILSAALLSAGAILAQTAPSREMRDLNGYFPFQEKASPQAWAARRADVELRVRLASGLFPMPEKTPLNAVVHGRVEREDYTIDRVFFESLPGHYVTGSLYLPKPLPVQMPGILCPHGHWPDGRFMDLGAGTAETRKQISTGAEKLESGARSPLQARCVHLARMGCAVFHYDMLGYADSMQFPEHRHGARKAGFLSPAADLSLQTYFGLQTWNNVRSLDFLLGLPGIDPKRIGCTGASGGGTQTMMLSGIDPRITAAFPCVMVSTAMQGGCTCENSHYLRINQGNVDIAALTAPRPLGMTAADDWTKELANKGLPDLQKLYAMLGVPGNVSAHIATQFPHNYNLPSRLAMYAFFNKHFQLGIRGPVKERDFVVSSRDELTVWSGSHARPGADKTGEAHEKAVCAWFTAQDARWQAMPVTSDLLIRQAWQTIVGRGTSSATMLENITKEDRGNHLFIQATVRDTDHGEDMPAAFLHPRNWTGKTVLWLAARGIESLAAAEPSADLKKLLDEGIAVACPRLHLEDAAEQPKAGDNLKARKDDFREFSGYTFGYNPPLLVRRVHDVLTLASMIRSNQDHPVKELQIIASQDCAPVALLAGVVLGDKVSRVQADPGGFRFASLTSPWHVHFVPGAVKYGDISALLRLNQR